MCQFSLEEVMLALVQVHCYFISTSLGLSSIEQELALRFASTDLDLMLAAAEMGSKVF